MAKRTVAQAILREIKLQLGMHDYSFAEEASCQELNIFKKETETTRIAFQYTLSGRGAYSASGTLKIIYPDLTTILQKLFEGTAFAAHYESDSLSNPWSGVGIESNIERFSNESLTYRCASEDDATAFSKYFVRQLLAAEQAFVLPHLDPAITVQAFMKPMHGFWPGPVRTFLEHLIAYGIKTSDAPMISYALQKAADVCGKLVPEARPLAFIATLKRQIEQ
ncbi:MAG: hypothetical protein ABWY06_04560 [Pseudomonas sp.]|uniref:hypothetical protein n=1 Tax=Pseudomonas sp. TaxID=306 RepID=UPI00339188F3